MSSNPKGIGPAGLALVKEFEGFPAGGRPYWDRPASDPRRVLTIGYGTTRINGRAVRSTDRLSREEASRLLVQQINGTYGANLTSVLNAVGFKANQNEYDALLSCIYNLGPGILERGRSLGDALRSGNRSRVTAAILLYCEPNSPSVHAGLLRRRRAEVALFRSKKGLAPKERKLKFGTKEKEQIERLQKERRSAWRAGKERRYAWSAIDKSHNDNAVEAKAWLIARANHLEKSDEIKDPEYRARKVRYLRDVAHNRNGRGR